VEKYKARQAAKNIPDIMGDIHPALAPKMAAPADEIIDARKYFLERKGFIKSKVTSITAGLRKRTAGFHMINEPGYPICAETKSINAIETMAKEAKETNLYSFMSFFSSLSVLRTGCLGE
jgi:hypothetical protein